VLEATELLEELLPQPAKATATASVAPAPRTLRAVLVIERTYANPASGDPPRPVRPYVPPEPGETHPG
jgi:hypothetical protein